MDMWKALGACLVTLASAMCGWAARQGMHRTLRIRRQLRLALEWMRAEMEIGMPTVAELFETVGKRLDGEVGRFLEGAAFEMAAVSGRSPRTALKIRMEQDPELFGPEERGLILEVGGCLHGSSSCCEGVHMDIDLVFKIAAVGIIVSILNQVLVRSGREEQATMTTLAGLIVVLMILVQRIAALFDLVKTLFEF